MTKRRKLHFHSLEDVGREAEALLMCGYERAGHWSLGTMGDHLGRALIYSCEGFPKTWPRPVQWIVRSLTLRRVLARKTWHWRFPAPISVNLETTDQEGVSCLLHGIEQFQQADSLAVEHAVLGELTRAEWFQFHLWHCEHHLSFLIPISEKPK